MTGWRVGASIGPEKVIRHMARFNINDESCTNHFIQHALAEVIREDQSDSKRILFELKSRRDICFSGLNTINGVALQLPESTFYLFPNVTDVMANKGNTDLDLFFPGLVIEQIP